MFAFALTSFYFAAGGTTGLSTLGGVIEEKALARDRTLLTLAWITGSMKVTGAALALALVQPWGRRFPQRWLLRAGWGSALY